MSLYHLTLQSGNIKTGPIPVSTSTRETCPPACPFYERGCYAKGGPLGIHWSIVTKGERGTPWEDFVFTVSQLPAGTFWRHNQAGDLPGTGNSIDTKALGQLVRANGGKRGFTYTHKPLVGDGNQETANRAAVRFSNGHGFTVNLSANTLCHADILSDLDAGPVVVVLPSGFGSRGKTPKGRDVVLCPAQKVDGMTCNKCRLCAKADRSVIIGFRAHGAASKAVQSIADSK